MLIDHCLAYQSPEKLPPASDRNKYTDPQTEITLRGKVLGTYSPKCEICTKFISSGFRESCGSWYIEMGYKI